LYGNAVGLIFAFTALSISVVGFPLLLDKPTSTLTAIIISFRAVNSNTPVMLLWGLIVITLLAAGAMLFLVGLAAILPILGHSTWHLYRKVIKADVEFIATWDASREPEPEIELEHSE
jgi:uncharacterized membrane protein